METLIDIKATLRQMLLPIALEKEDESVQVVYKLLVDQGMIESSFVQFIKVKYEAWSTEQILDPLLKQVVERAIEVDIPNPEINYAHKYFDIHQSLLKNPFISFELATIVLSHLRLIATLAYAEKMSAAKITKVIKSIDSRLDILTWKQIQSILSILKINPQLISENVEKLYDEDEKSEEEYFADADIEEAAQQVGEVAKRLLFRLDASWLLNQLIKPGKSHLPYLQILHYQCLISGFYDHSFPTLYEFNPRGTVANWLFSKWNSLLHTANPILNNAKAVDVADDNWANSRKKKEYEQAVNFVSLLKGLDGMGFAAAQELTTWIRRWLVRYIKLYQLEVIPIPSNLADEQIERILNFIVEGSSTATYGILEQRFVDVFASFIHPEEDGWRSRGLLDSVNANNVSRRKLGDCDFQHSGTLDIVAYEAHGGVLSRIYFEGHIRTLKRSLSRRTEELEGIASLHEWKITIVFVAYGFEELLPKTVVVEGLQIEVRYLTFTELLQQSPKRGMQFTTIFQQLFINSINDRRTPSFVREIIRDATLSPK